jgi:hypothetical protein
MTDAQIIAALEKLSLAEKRALAAKMLTHERNVYRWQKKPPTVRNNALVREALIRELAPAKKGKR